MSHISNMYGFSDIEILDKLDGLCEGERGLFWFLDISASLYSFSSKCNRSCFSTSDAVLDSFSSANVQQNCYLPYLC